MTLRRTKIIATLGPATDEPGKIQALLAAGVDIVRLNMSHGDHKMHQQRLETVLTSAKAIGKIVGILIDLQGPKIRIGRFADKEGIVLVEGAHFCLKAEHALGDINMVGLDYPELIDEVKLADELLLDDGRLSLVVESVSKDTIACVVKNGGRLTSNKGLNRKGGGLSAPSLTEKDKEDIVFLASLPVDYVALSFPKSAKDIDLARELLHAAGSQAHLVAKIERAEAIDNIDEIIKASDAVMVARGDLGVEIGYAQLPGVQKHIIQRARALDKAVITATQMMESMIYNPIPTRAEVSDVANAILDGTDAVMLSAETASGEYPIKVVQAMEEICVAAERYRSTSSKRELTLIEQHDKAIAMAAMYLANQVAIKAIVTLTESGSTPLWMSRIRSGIPIYALSRHARTRGRLTLLRGVYPVEFDVTQYKNWQATQYALQALQEQNILQVGDKVLVSKGDTLGVGGNTNALKIVTVTATPA